VTDLVERVSFYRTMQILMVSVLLTLVQFPAQAQARPRKAITMEHLTSYRTVQIDGLSIFYREPARRRAHAPAAAGCRLPAHVRPTLRPARDRYHLSRDYPARHKRLADPKTIRVHVRSHR